MSGTVVEFRTRSVVGGIVVGEFELGGVHVALTVDEMPETTEKAYRELIVKLRDGLTEALNDTNGIQVRLV